MTEDGTLPSGHREAMREVIELAQRLSMDFDVLATEAQLYALLPYKVAQVVVQATAPKGQPVTYTAKLAGLAAPAAHVLRVQVLGPDGKERPRYAKNLTTAQGTAQGTINLALDDTPGTWKVVAKDVATGVTGTATFKVGH